MGARTRLVKPPCPLHGGSVLSARHGQHTRRGPLPTAGRRPLPTDGRRGRPCSAPTPAQQARPRRGRGPTVLEAAPRTLKAHTPRHTEVLGPRSDPSHNSDYATMPLYHQGTPASAVLGWDRWTAGQLLPPAPPRGALEFQEWTCSIFCNLSPCLGQWQWVGPGRWPAHSASLWVAGARAGTELFALGGHRVPLGGEPRQAHGRESPEAWAPKAVPSSWPSSLTDLVPEDTGPVWLPAETGL